MIVEVIGIERSTMDLAAGDGPRRLVSCTLLVAAGLRLLVNITAQLLFAVVVTRSQVRSEARASVRLTFVGL